MVRHPFERATLRAIRLACLALFVAWGVLTIVLLAVAPLDHARQLWLFLHASGAGEAAARVAAWPADVRATVRLLVGVDFVYDVVHNNAVALLCLWAARRIGRSVATATARTVAWVMWLDTLCNVVENSAALHIVSGGGLTPWFAIVVASTAFRFATLWLGFALGVLGFAVAYRTARQPRSRRAA